MKQEKEMKTYFNLKMVEDYGNVVDKTYKSQSKEAKWFYETRDKLYYLVSLLATELNEDFIVVYKEKPNGQRGPALIGFKNYILAGFAPKNNQVQDDLFMKLELTSLNKEPVLALNIDLNFRKKSSPFNNERDNIYNKHYKEWSINEDFPNNWKDLVFLLKDEVKELKNHYMQYVKNLKASNKIDVKNDFIEWLLRNPKSNYFENDKETLNRYLDKYNTYFSTDIFKVSKDSFVDIIELINRVAYQDEKSDFFLYSIGESTHRPRAILGKKNYIKFLNEIFKNEEDMLEEKNKEINSPLNQILYGPPGTGKTYNTVLEAAKIVIGNEPSSFKEAQDAFNKNLGDRIEFITFHQNYSYEDFIQGLRPDTEEQGNLTFFKKDGVFKKIADRALKNFKASNTNIQKKLDFYEVFEEFIAPLVEGEVDEIEIKMKKVSFFITNIKDKSIEFRKTSGGTDHTLSIKTLEEMYNEESTKNIQGLSSYYRPLLNKLLDKGKLNETEHVSLQNYVIIIDEINRANISRVFGELITLIEKDKRYNGKIPLTATLPSGDKFTVPPNLYIIGTMNTADKSIALLDIALRRRFEFVPKYPVLEIVEEGVNLVNDSEILQKINKQIIDKKGHDFTIGHSYFMGEEYTLKNTIDNKVIPLLLEYFMNDTKEVEDILKAAELTVKGWPMKLVAND